MKGFLSLDGGLMQILNRVMYIVAVNLLFLLCCIPVITIGASATAMYTVFFKFQKGLEPPILKTFFGAFKSNFKISLKGWIPMLVILLTLIVNYYILNNTGIIGTGIAGAAFRIFLDLVLIVMLALWIYLFPAMAYFENNIWGYLTYAVSLAVSRLPKTILLMFVHVIPIVIIVCLLQTYSAVGAILLMFFGFSVSAYLSGKVLLPLFGFKKESLEAPA